MGIKYLWDTNTVIYFLQNQFSESASQFIEKTMEDSQPSISVITEIELLCWKTATEEDLEILHSFINTATTLELKDAVKFKTAEIRKMNKIKLPDAIIAATAIIHNLILITRNVKDFKNINELETINPFEE